MPKDDQPAKVPPRNDQKKVEVYARSRASEISGKNPDSHYEWKSTDPKSPGYYGKYTSKHEIGNDLSGYAMAEAWEFCSNKDGLEPGRPRDDTGKPIDTAMRHGDLVLMRTTKDNKAVYDEIDRRTDEVKSKRLRAGDDERVQGANGGSASYRARVGVGYDNNSNPRDLLNERGA